MTTRDARSPNDDDDADFEFIDFEPPTPADTTTADTSLAARHPHDPDSFLPAALDDIVLSSLHDLHFVLSPSTTILRVSANCLSLLGCEPSLLLGQRLAALVHADDAHVFSTEISSALHLTGYQHAAVAAGHLARATALPPFRFHCRIRSVVHVDADYSAFELVGHYQVKEPASLAPLQLMVPPPGVISITARPAFTSAGYRMDGMLELKMEQVRLVRRIAQIKREAVEEGWGFDDGADEDADEGQRQQQQQTAAAAATTAGYAGAFRHVDARAFGRAMRRSSSSRSRSSPPRFVLGDASPAGRAQQPAPGRIKEEAEEEDAPGPSKVKVGELGIPFVVRPGGFEKKLSEGHRLPKRKFMVREFCCSRCGTLESPEWRSGPDGPKTLCNACGLKYAKEQKRAARMKPVASE